MAEQQSRLVGNQALLEDSVARNWYESKDEGGRKSAMYHLVAYLRWRVGRGYSVKPGEWIEDRTSGTTRL